MGTLPITPVWDVARDPIRCYWKRCVIGQGEPYRILKIGRPICESCSVDLDATPAPPDLPMLTVRQRLGLNLPVFVPAASDPIPDECLATMPNAAAAIAARQAGTRTALVAARTRASIRKHATTAPAPRLPIDYRARAAGERDE